MTRSAIFHTPRRTEIEGAIVGLLNEQPEFLSARTANSTRATGDAIQAILSERLRSLLGDLCVDYIAEFERRALGDLAFHDADGLYYSVDVKTHRLDASFHMPNLTSVKRLAEFYNDDSNYFIILLIEYDIRGTTLEASAAHFVPIEFLAWNCLTLGALGWGQLQLASNRSIEIDVRASRRDWMLELCEHLARFYPQEIGKIQQRVRYFERIQASWRARDR
jgi:hypothetical protein